jgi:hypothetical protein
MLMAAEVWDRRQAMFTRFVGLVLAFVFAAGSAFATPERIIILRHGEKANDWRLCPVGEARAKALAQSYLGRDAANSLFTESELPAAILTITRHALELAAPAAATWPLPITHYSVMPEPMLDKRDFTRALNSRTQEAVRDVMANLAWAGKTVVMVWEHHHIANAKVEAEFPGEKVTLRQLLDLDALEGVPVTWPDETYDYFWIVEFASGVNTPTSFRTLKQTFPAAAGNIPENDWGTSDGLSPRTGCEGGKPTENSQH